jgi:hypothetical protein
MPRAHLNRNSIFGSIADSIRLGVAEAEICCGYALPDEDRWQTLVASVALKNVDVPRSRGATSSWREAVRGHKYGGLPRSFFGHQEGRRETQVMGLEDRFEPRLSLRARNLGSLGSRSQRLRSE